MIGVIWYNNNAQQARLEVQRTEEAAQAARDEELAREEQESVASAAPDSPVEEGDPAVRDDGAIVMGDEITEGTIVMESITAEPVLLDPDETTRTVEIIDTTEPVDPAATLETGAVDGADRALQGIGQDGTAPDATTGTATTDPTQTEPEELLTPENFDRDEVLALIEDAEQLTDEQRSTLRAVVEGASANPAMIEAAIGSIRAALDLPALN
ncbi:MAG: hypothetical protein ACK4GC_04060 [Paracoccaceae bacterium]